MHLRVLLPLIVYSITTTTIAMPPLIDLILSKRKKGKDLKILAKRAKKDANSSDNNDRLPPLRR